MIEYLLLLTFAFCCIVALAFRRQYRINLKKQRANAEKWREHLKVTTWLTDIEIGEFQVD